MSILVALSGKAASGKDSVAEALTRTGGPWARLAFAAAVKDEAQRIIDTVTAAPDEPAAGAAAARDLAASRSDAARAVGLVWTDVRSGAVRAGTQRHPAVRALLQFWGGIRVRDDPAYWLAPAATRLAGLRAEGVNVVLTDVRLPPEAEWARREGFLLVRLDAPEDVRWRRMVERDGVAPDRAALRDRSETALDDYPGFDLRLDNSGPIGPTVAAITDALRL